MLKKHDSRSKPSIALAFLLLYCAFCANVFPQTARSKAEARFSALGWAERSAEGEDASSGASDRTRAPRRFELEAANADGSSALSQDTGDFPAAPLAALMPNEAAPPMLPGAGSLNFAAAPRELITLLGDIAASLKTRDYSGIKTASTSPFIPIMLEYMMRRLPQVESSSFAGVEIAKDGRSARAILRLNLADNRLEGDSGIPPVFATAEAVLEEGEWRAADVIFDGDSYGKAAKPPRK